MARASLLKCRSPTLKPMLLISPHYSISMLHPHPVFPMYPSTWKFGEMGKYKPVKIVLKPTCKAPRSLIKAFNWATSTSCIWFKNGYSDPVPPSNPGTSIAKLDWKSDLQGSDTEGGSWFEASARGQEEYSLRS